MDKLFLLDAYALIYRAYYAFIKNPRINSKGENTSAVLGFVNTLEEVLSKEQPTHIGVAFDPSGGTFRHEAYPEYKASGLGYTVEPDFARAIALAGEKAQGAGRVVLSPACASFDMFRNFEERGRIFKEIVNSLKA